MFHELDAKLDLGEIKLRTRFALIWVGGLILLMLAAGVGLVLSVRSDILSSSSIEPSITTVIFAVICLVFLRGIIYLNGKRHHPGKQLRETDDPRLFEQIKAVAKRLGCSPPKVVRVVPDAGVLINSERYLFRTQQPEFWIGIALLSHFTIGELRAALAFEFVRTGIFPNQQLKWVCEVHDGMRRVVRESRRTPMTFLFYWFAHGYLRITSPLSGLQKETADNIAAKLVGGDLYAECLGKAYVMSRQYVLFLQQEIIPLLSAGSLPDNIYTGFCEWLKHNKEHDRVEESFANIPGVKLESTELERRKALIRARYTGECWLDDMKALELFRDFGHVQTETTLYIVDMFHRQGSSNINANPKVVKWNELEKIVITPDQSTRAKFVLDTLEHLVKRKLEIQDGIGVYLDIVDVPELRLRLASKLDANILRLPPVLRTHVVQRILVRFLGALVGNALVEDQGYRWKKAIARPLWVESDDGTQLDPFMLSKDFIEGTVDVGRFRMALFEHGLFVSK
jgi:hypothetical protein